jgi:hypothetical protein
MKFERPVAGKGSPRSALPHLPAAGAEGQDESGQRHQLKRGRCHVRHDRVEPCGFCLVGCAESGGGTFREAAGRLTWPAARCARRHDAGRSVARTATIRDETRFDNPAMPD